MANNLSEDLPHVSGIKTSWVSAFSIFFLCRKTCPTYRGFNLFRRPQAWVVWKRRSDSWIRQIFRRFYIAKQPWYCIKAVFVGGGFVWVRGRLKGGFALTACPRRPRWCLRARRVCLGHGLCCCWAGDSSVNCPAAASPDFSAEQKAEIAVAFAVKKMEQAYKNWLTGKRPKELKPILTKLRGE